jgi:hypothetical protein
MDSLKNSLYDHGTIFLPRISGVIGWWNIGVTAVDILLFFHLKVHEQGSTDDYS